MQSLMDTTHQSHVQSQQQCSSQANINASTSRPIITQSKLIINKRQYEEIGEFSGSSSNDEFSIPNKKHTISNTNTTKKYVVDLTEVHNKFSPLEKMSEEYDDITSQQPAPKIKIPPIFLHEINNYQQIIKDLNDIATDNYSIQQQGKTLKININSIDDYRKITKFLDESHLPYHTFRDPNSKTLEVIIRNVPYSLTNEEIFSELKSQNLPVLKVIRLLYKDKQPMPLCVVELQNNDDGKEIFNLKQIQHAIISVEHRRKSKDIPQCTRCQRYGHTKNFCRLTPRCVKCLENHHYSECKKPREVQPKCVNCGEGHPANFKGCSYYVKLKQKEISNSSLPTGRQNNVQTPAPIKSLENFPNLFSNSSPPPQPSWKRPPTVHNQDVSLSNSSPPPQPSLKRPSTVHNQDVSLSTDFLEDIIKSIISFLKPHLPKIQSFLIKLATGLFNNNNES